MDGIITWWNNLMYNLNTFDYAGAIKDSASLLTFEMFLKIILAYFFILWVAIIVWVTKDIINRTNNIFYQVISILSVLILTPLGIVVYLLIRPSRTLFEKHYEAQELEEEEVELKEVLSSNNAVVDLTCQNCGYSVKSDFKFCPKCRVELNKVCNVCKKMIEPDWENCPYCGSFQGEGENSGPQLALDVENREVKLAEEEKLENKKPKSFRLFRRNKKTKNTNTKQEKLTPKKQEENKKLEEKVSGNEKIKQKKEVEKTKSKETEKAKQTYKKTNEKANKKVDKKEKKPKKKVEKKEETASEKITKDIKDKTDKTLEEEKKKTS